MASQPKKAKPDDTGEAGNTVTLTDREEQEVEDRAPPRAAVVFETIRREGTGELERSAIALLCSALAAGLSMGFSFVGVGMLHARLPDTPWRPLIESFGYTIGFLIVILGRQQLFTENTLTVILPLLDSPQKMKTLRKVARLWIIVLAANLVGTALFAIVIAQSHVFPDEMKRAFDEIGATTGAPAFGPMFVRGIMAGWLIALMVWLLPAAQYSRPWVIVYITYFVSAFGLTHIIAGSAEVIYTVARGNQSFAHYVMGFFIPVFCGNVIGGVSLVALLNFGQVMNDD